MKTTKMGWLLGAMMATVVGLGSARAGNECEPAQKQFVDSWGLVNTACDVYNNLPSTKTKLPCDDVAKVAEAAEKILDAARSVFNIGPKEFAWGETYEGNIVSLTKRLWIGAMPTSTDAVTIKIEHRSGEGKVKVNVCSGKKDGTMNPPVSYFLEAGSSKVISNTQHRLVSVEIIGQKLGKSFGYKLTATKNN
jgi:hypothetical protein